MRQAVRPPSHQRAAPASSSRAAAGIPTSIRRPSPRATKRSRRVRPPSDVLRRGQPRAIRVRRPRPKTEAKSTAAAAKTDTKPRPARVGGLAHATTAIRRCLAFAARAEACRRRAAARPPRSCRERSARRAKTGRSGARAVVTRCARGRRSRRARPRETAGMAVGCEPTRSDGAPPSFAPRQPALRATARPAPRRGTAQPPPSTARPRAAGEEPRPAPRFAGGSRRARGRRSRAARPDSVDCELGHARPRGRGVLRPGGMHESHVEHLAVLGAQPLELLDADAH